MDATGAYRRRPHPGPAALRASRWAHWLVPADPRDLVPPWLPDRSWLLTADGRAWLARVELPAVARQAVDLALRMIDYIDTELDLLDTALAHIARTQPGCKALMGR